MKECSEFCEELCIPNITTDGVDMSKFSWKLEVKKAIERKKNNELKNKIANYSKLEVLKGEEKCELKDYISSMTMEQARTNFRIRSMMITSQVILRTLQISGAAGHVQLT